MSKLLQKFASEKLTPGGGETATGKRKRSTSADGDREITVGTKAKVDGSLRPVSAGKSDVKKGGKKKVSESSIVYLGHIPRGFEEEEIEGFFSQFGDVKRIKVFRNIKTNNIRGYAFIQFETPEVAEVAAEAIDGYFLNDRKLVCHVIPPESIHRGMFARPEITMLEEEMMLLDALDGQADVPEEKLTVKTATKKLQKHVKELKRRQEKLKKLGYDFEIPTPDVPIVPSTSTNTVAVPNVASSSKKNRKAEAAAKVVAATPVATPAAAVSKSSKKRKAEEAVDQVEDVPVVVAAAAASNAVEGSSNKKKKAAAVSATPATPATANKKKAAATPAPVAAHAPVTAPAPVAAPAAPAVEATETKKASKLQKISATKSKATAVAAPTPVVAVPEPVVPAAAVVKAPASAKKEKVESKIPKVSKAKK